MKKSNLKIFGWFAFAVISFLFLGQFSISVGDDFGYMFADSALHKGDGKMITNIVDCFSTQAKHYLSTNGRFLVHTATHFFTAIASIEIFRAINAVMFGLLWLLALHFITPRHECKGWYASLLALFLLWTCLPSPGTVMLSLVAFALNYMWTGVAYLGFLLWLKKSATSRKSFKKNRLYYLLCGFSAILIGSLQESYSLPISASLFLMAAFKFKRLNSLSATMIVSFFVGCGVGVFAPGNWCRAAQGGGFTLDSIIRKCEVLSLELMYSAISALVVLIVISAIINRKNTMLIIKRNTFFLIAIAVSIVLAMLTFTSSRQLFCPSLFAIIVMGRLIMGWKENVAFKGVSTVVMCCSLTIIFVGGYILRKNTYENYMKVTAQLGGKASVIFADATNANYNSESKIVRLFAKTYAPDPFENHTLRLTYDGYTKRGLSRIYWKNRKSSNIKNIIPYPAKVIAERFKTSTIKPQPIKGTSRYKTIATKIDSIHKGLRFSTKLKEANKYMPFKSEKKSNALPYEKFTHEGYIYILIPATSPDSIILKK